MYIKRDLVLIPMGGDFQYMNGEDNYHWLEYLMQKMNTKMGLNNMHFMYSTPECYLKALKEEGGNLNLTERTGDFFPLISSKTSVSFCIKAKNLQVK